MYQRLLSWVLSCVMLLSYIPMTIWAVDSTTDIKAIQKPTGICIVEDYDDYFGDSWQDKLGLPTSVQVRTSNGNTASVDVIWN